MDRKKPRPKTGRGLPSDRENGYLFPRLDALSGFSFVFFEEEVEATCVARLQLPFFHFNAGSGHAVQNQPDVYSELRLQPSQLSTISWQIPPLKEHPDAVMKGHSIPSLTVVQTNGTTSFSYYSKIKSQAYPPGFCDRKILRNIIRLEALVNLKIMFS